MSWSVNCVDKLGTLIGRFVHINKGNVNIPLTPSLQVHQFIELFPVYRSFVVLSFVSVGDGNRGYEYIISVIVLECRWVFKKVRITVVRPNPEIMENTFDKFT